MKSDMMKAVLGIGMMMVLAACGSSGGGGTPGVSAGATISGTAAAGAPVVGFVAVRDSSTNPQPVKTNIPIEANGHYSVDVTGLTAPFAFLASGTAGGRDVSLYSVATQADVGGTINITPFTDLITRNIAASAVDAYINNGSFSGLTPGQLDAERVTLTTRLAPALTAMGLSGSIDLLRTTFNANSTGLDRFMDVVRVSTTPTTATITNILDAANTLTINTTTGAATGTLGIANLAPTGTPVDQIKQTFQAFAGLFATSLPSPTDLNLLALFSSTFLDGGENLSAFLTDITTQQRLIGINLSNLVVDSVDVTAGTAQVHFVPVNGAGLNFEREGALNWQVKRNDGSGVWELAGDQRIASVRVKTGAQQNICTVGAICQPSGTTYFTGLELEIDNRGLRPLGSAVVTGPGLPAGGVTLTAQPNVTWFMISPLSCQGCFGNLFTMIDPQISGLLPNSSYTVQLYSNDATPQLMATYPSVVPVPPVLNLALASLAYPSITNRQSLANITAATLTPSWQIPAGLFGDDLSVFVFQTNVENLQVRADVRTNGTATSGTSTLAITAPAAGGAWTDGNYFIKAFDQHGGEVATSYQ